MTTNSLSPVEQLVESWRKDIGTTYSFEEMGKYKHIPTPPYANFNKNVTRDGIKHFMDGIGDLNPLYRDREYAKKTKYECLIAPPCYLFSVILGPAPIRNASMSAALHGFDSGGEWEWLRPLREDDELSFRVIAPSDVELKASRFGGKLAIFHGRAEVTRQGGELVAINKYWSIYTEKEKAVKRDTYQEIAKPTEYTEEDIKKIFKAQDSEVRRGAEPRYWEDVQIGEELTPVVIGPYTFMEAIAWLIGSGMSISVSDRIYRKMGAREGKAFYDPDLNIDMNVNITHFYENWAKTVGVPKPYDFGGQRYSWLGMLLTNWIGDEGFLWKMHVEHRSFSMYGDTIWCKGNVVNKHVTNGRCCVDIECGAVNQMGKSLSPGKATVILPSRERGPVIYPEASDIITEQVRIK